jgi:hypothetical protein
MDVTDDEALQAYLSERFVHGRSSLSNTSRGCTVGCTLASACRVLDPCG